MIRIAVLLKFYRGEISPFDEAALECALETPDAEVTALAMAPLAAKEKLEYFTRLGVRRAILLSDPAYAGSDTLATSKTLAEALRRLKPDLVLCGRQSMDGDTAQVPPEVAQLLGMRFYPYALEYGKSEIRTRLGEQKIVLPAVMSVERIRILRFAGIRSKVTPAEVWNNALLGLDPSQCGQKGSPTRVLETYRNDRAERHCIFCEKDALAALIETGMQKNCIPAQSPQATKKMHRIFVVGEDVAVAKGIAEQVIRLSDGSAEELAARLREAGAEAVLFSATLHNRVLAPQIAAILGCGLAADCIGLETDGKNLFCFRPANSGGIVAKIACDSVPAMATVRECRVGGETMFCVGMGAKEEIPRIRRLANEYGAELCATRKVVDAGLMPYESQIGLTGRIVSPKVYVAFGVEGEVQHVAGMERSGTVIAINKNKNAKIFKYADYGIAEDIRNVGL